jgi:L-ascorbate metabolism protein UlaG (beta-lactamase superfamily)
MGPSDALRAVKLLSPNHVIPIHYNTWDLIHQDADTWGSQVTRETKTIVHILKPGESITL